MTEMDERWPVYLGESSRFWWMHLVRGAAALAFGAAAVFLSVPTAVLVAMLGAFALVLAAFELVEAYRLRSLRKRLLS
jgi:uncharacterized membrane protein HdeD (DUF308 family)